MKMLKVFLALAVVSLPGWVTAQQCPNPVSPLAGETDVSVSTSIQWEPVTGVTGYIIRIGTTPGGAEILNQSVGSATSFTPPFGLPEDTQIYVTITLFFFNQPDIDCTPYSFRTEDVTAPPGCTTLAFPVNGATNVNVATNVSWAYSPTATGYLVFMGNTPGGTEIANGVDITSGLTFDPPGDLDPETTYYLRIVPYNENGQAGPCSEESFTTGVLATIPSCTNLISPANGALNVPLTPELIWNSVPDATGYIVSIGTSPFENDVLDAGVFTSNSTFVIDFLPNSVYFVQIIPFNDAGQALGCTQESFTTFLGCGPYFDPGTGELVTLNPEIDFPDTIGICEGNLPLTISSTDTADGFRWYRRTTSSTVLIGEGPDIAIDAPGDYVYEAYNEESGATGNFECTTTQDFTVTQSQIATIDDVQVTLGVGTIQIRILASGLGNYEYALDDPNGNFQDSPIFDGISISDHVVYVRDKNGCGTVSETVTANITLEGFPKFFTPNGDGINDRWQYIVPPSGQNPIRVIYIFDQFGTLLATLDKNSLGWDGNFNGSRLPSSDYWFRALDDSNNEVKGHFSLKR